MAKEEDKLIDNSSKNDPIESDLVEEDITGEENSNEEDYDDGVNLDDDQAESPSGDLDTESETTEDKKEVDEKAKSKSTAKEKTRTKKSELVAGTTTKARIVKKAEKKQGQNKKNNRIVPKVDKEYPSWTDGMALSPKWWAPTFVTLLIIGIIWLIIYYFSSGSFPIASIGSWNIFVGVAIMLVGFLMTLKWR